MNNQAVIETAQQTLLEYGVTQFPIRVSPLCDRMGIHCKLYHPKDDNDGCCGIRNNAVYIFIAERFAPTTKKDLRHTAEYRRFTAAHELGHALRGHVGSWSWTAEDGTVHHITGHRMTSKQIEREADDFATEFLMPQCVLLSLGITTTDEIMRLCEVTKPDATVALKRLNKRRRQRIPLSPLETQICAQFHDYIKGMGKHGTT